MKFNSFSIKFNHSENCGTNDMFKVIHAIKKQIVLVQILKKNLRRLRKASSLLKFPQIFSKTTSF